MITPSGKYYLYRHIRTDKNIPFYIGIGTKTKKDIKYYSYYRANKKFNRNSYWINITKKTDYEVEILLESDDYEFIKEKEKEFIKLYGRKENNTGILANMTNGGEGNKGIIFTEEYRKKISIANKGKKRSQQTKLKLSKSLKGINRPYARNNAKTVKILQFDMNNNFIQEFNSLREACDNLSVKWDKYISKVCKGEKKHYKKFIWKFKE